MTAIPFLQLVRLQRMGQDAATDDSSRQNNGRGYDSDSAKRVHFITLCFARTGEAGLGTFPETVPAGEIPFAGGSKDEVSKRGLGMLANAPDFAKTTSG